MNVVSVKRKKCNGRGVDSLKGVVVGNLDETVEIELKQR